MQIISKFFYSFFLSVCIFFYVPYVLSFLHKVFFFQWIFSFLYAVKHLASQKSKRLLQMPNVLRKSFTKYSKGQQNLPIILLHPSILSYLLPKRRTPKRSQLFVTNVANQGTKPFIAKQNKRPMNYLSISLNFRRSS